MSRKSASQNIMALIKMSWRTWLIVGFVSDILYVLMLMTATSWYWLTDSFGWQKYVFNVGPIIGILGGLLPLVRFSEVIKSRNTSTLNKLICFFVGILATIGFIVLFLFIMLALYLILGFAQ